MLVERIAFTDPLKILIIKVIPIAVFAFRKRDVVTASHRTMMYCERVQSIVGVASQTWVNVRQTELAQVNLVTIRSVLLNLSKVAVKTLDVED